MLVAKQRHQSVSWPDKLYQLREFYGDGTRPLTQEAAAARLHTSLGSWRNWEQGRRQPTPAIVRLLELTFPEFFSEKS